jgi:hypothetical protein
MQDRAKFGMTMMGLSETYGRPVSKAVMEIWWKVFEKFDDALFEKAVMSHVTDTGGAGKFFPTPADILTRLDGKTSERALGAWNLVLEGVKRVGSWESPAFSDPIIHMVLNDMGGWVKICALDNAELPFVMAEFNKRYEEKYNSCKDGRIRAEYPALYGQINLERNRQALPLQDFRPVGDVNRVQELLAKAENRVKLASSVNEAVTIKRIEQ